MARRGSIQEWVMVTCDVSIERLLETYSGFCVMRISDKKFWTNEVARFYEGDPCADYEDAVAYADSISSVVLKSCFIEDFWKRLGHGPRGAKRNGRIRS